MTSSPVLAILKLQHEKVRISMKSKLMSKISSYDYLTWRSPLLYRASYVVLFDLKPLIEDGNLQVCACTKKSLRSPQNTLKSMYKFPWGVPRSPSHNPFCGAHILYFPCPPQILSAALRAASQSCCQPWKQLVLHK